MAYRMLQRGDPGFFGSIGKAIGSVAKVATSFLPGPLGAVARTVVGAVARPGGQPAQMSLAGMGQQPVIRTPGLTGAVQRALPGGATGYMVGGGRVGGRRMNPGNAKAARRAIRRIKSVRKLLVGIERQLPKRKCACGTAKRRK